MDIWMSPLYIKLVTLYDLGDFIANRGALILLAHFDGANYEAIWLGLHITDINPYHFFYSKRICKLTYL